MHLPAYDYSSDLLLLLVLSIAGGLAFNRMVAMYKQNNDWLALAFAKIGDALITTDKLGRITRMNAMGEKLTGWKAAEAKGKLASELVKFFDHDTRVDVESPIMAALGSGTVIKLQGKIMLRGRDNSETPVECVVAPLGNRRNQIKSTVIIFRDISERYSGLQKLAESEERLRVVTNQARIGLVMINRDRRYIYANNFYMQMIGFSDLYVLGKRVEDVLPVLYDRIRPFLDRAFKGERLSYEITGNYKKELGENRTYSITYEPQIQHSLVMNVVIVILDITDIKNAHAR